MNKIKLIIWDLDETFWEGTLSEGEIIPIENNINILKELTKRGIVNSICSKNDFEKAKTKLEELKVWEYFIFPKIDWTPKGEMVKEILDNCQLRAENTLFIDDNFQNIEEVKYYNPTIYAELPAYCNQILTHDSFRGKPDPNHEKLKDYKLLEKKADYKKKFSSNNKFLNQSDIKLSFITDLIGYEERVSELIEKTNQLNFTKKRISKSEVEELLVNLNYTNSCIHVEDKYGDYGIIGFVSIDKINNKLEHFVFSCRIMNLGIEQYIFAKLNFPSIDIVGDVSATLNINDFPNWIEEIEFSEKKILKNQEAKRIFFLGGCDLTQIFASLQNLDLNLFEEANYVSSNNFPIHREHTENILNSIRLNKKEQECLIKVLPFLDHKFYETKLFEQEYDVIIFSPLMDYTQDIFEQKLNNKLTVTWGGHQETLSNPDKWTKLKQWAKRKGIHTINDEFLSFFYNTFQSKGKISPDKFVQNLQLIIENLKGQPKIIIINGADVECPSNEDDRGIAKIRHQNMNAAIDEFVKNNENLYLLDVRKYVKTDADLIDSIRHYRPKVYRNLAMDLKSILEFILDQPIQEQFIKSDVISKANLIRKFLYRIRKKFFGIK